MDNEFSRIDIQQGIGEHNTFSVQLQQGATRGIIEDKASAWIGEEVIIGLGEVEDIVLESFPPAEYFKGIVTSISLSRQSGSSSLTINGRSATALIDDGPNTKSFTDKSLQEIIDEVLLPYQDSLNGTFDVHPKHHDEALPYVVQYRESNFTFMVRLANRYGEWFYHDGLHTYFGKPADEKSIKLNFDEEGLTYFHLSVQAIPANFKLSAYNYLEHKSYTAEAPLNTETNKIGQALLNKAATEIYPEAPSMAINTAMDEEELKNLAERREEVSADEIVMLHGASRNPKLKLGGKITVVDEELGEEYGTYTITSLSHEIYQGGEYSNQFEAVPEEVATPPLTSMATPPFCEAQLAKVTAVNDDKGLGRVKVKFIWQEGTDEISPWIRVASPYTGADKGFYIVPEVGDQVLVAFENNHPDKPYVLTGMYNGKAKPEWFSKDNHLKGFKSKGQNEWKFDDKEESITLSAPKAINLNAGKSISINTGGESDSHIAMNAGEGTVTVMAKTIKIGDSGGTTTIMLDAGQSIIVGNGTDGILIKGKSTSVEGSIQVNVKGGSAVKVSANGTVSLNGSSVKMM